MQALEALEEQEPVSEQVLVDRTHFYRLFRVLRPRILRVCRVLFNNSSLRTQDWPR